MRPEKWIKILAIVSNTFVVLEAQFTWKQKYQQKLFQLLKKIIDRRRIQWVDGDWIDQMVLWNFVKFAGVILQSHQQKGCTKGWI